MHAYFGFRWLSSSSRYLTPYPSCDLLSSWARCSSLSGSANRRNFRYLERRIHVVHQGHIDVAAPILEGPYAANRTLRGGAAELARNAGVRELVTLVTVSIHALGWLEYDNSGSCVQLAQRRLRLLEVLLEHTGPEG